jgi:translation initiation factor 5B
MAVWPCRLKIIACFCKRDPIILGVDILDGNLRVGTPLCVVKQDPATNAKEIIELGKMYGFHSSYSSFGVTNTTSQYFSGNQSQIYGSMYRKPSLLEPVLMKSSFSL